MRLTLRDRAAARERAVAAQIHVLAAELAAHVRAGRTLAQAIGDVCDELPEPAADAARRVAAAVALGVPVGDAMARLGGGPDGAVLAAAVQVQVRMGGDLAALLDGLAAALLDHADARRAAEVATAQARATARTVAAMPVAGGALLALVDRPALAALIGAPLGLASLACSALLCAGGLALIRRLAAVEA